MNTLVFYEISLAIRGISYKIGYVRDHSTKYIGHVWKKITQELHGLLKNNLYKLFCCVSSHQIPSLLLYLYRYYYRFVRVYSVVY